MIVHGLIGPFIFMIFTGIIGLAVSLILFISHNEKSLGNRLLAMSIFSISYILLINASFLTNFYDLFPQTYRILSFLTFCIGPFSYLYVRTVLRQEYRLAKTDYLFFLPALLAVINRIPYHLMSRQEQLDFIHQINLNLKLVVLESEGLLPPGYLAIFRIVLTLGFVIAQLLLIRQWKKKMWEKSIYIIENNKIVSWLEVYSILLLVSSVLLFVQTSLQVGSPIHFEQLIIFTMGMTNLVASITLFARPKILYGLVGWLQEEKPIVSIKDFTKLEEYFKNNQQFLSTTFTIHELAQELKIPVYQLSTFINQEYQKSFVQYINDQRFQQVLVMKEADPDFKSYTIDYIGKKIGFSSRTSFVEFIKKRTGKTPSEFLRGA
jgi:AraC-like DNA-binding protein